MFRFVVRKGFQEFMEFNGWNISNKRKSSRYEEQLKLVTFSNVNIFDSYRGVRGVIFTKPELISLELVFTVLVLVELRG